MKKNMGIGDRTFRMFAGILIAVLVFTNVVTGTAAIVLMAFAAIFIITGLVGFCPLYALFKISTYRREKMGVHQE